MIKNYLMDSKKIINSLLVLLLVSNSSIAQKKESAEAYIAKMRIMADSIKKAKADPANKKTNKSSTLTGRFANGKYSTNKTTIDNAFNQLNVSDKEKVKNYPKVPDAFRTDLDAQLFLNNLGKIDINSDIQKYAKEKSILLIGYLATFSKTKRIADAIVAEAKTLKTEFEKKNPSIKFGANVGKTYVGENALVYLPLAEASFVDEVVEAKYVNGNIEFPKENCIGTPDYVLMNNLKNNKGIYSLGLNGSLIIKFANNGLVNVNGPDLFIFEAGEIEPTNVEISKDGKAWINIGKIEGGTASLDIEKFTKPNECFYYVRLTDLNTKSTIAGADIDAIAAIGAAIKLNLNAEVLFDLGKSVLKQEGVEAVKKLAVQLQTMPNAIINIDGYTDDIGANDANIKLSLQRAQAVSEILKQELKNKTGFVFKEIGKGNANPTVPNTTDENRKKNRRVEIIVTPN